MASVNKEFVEEFIDILKEESALWQTKSDKYKNKNEKNKAWNNLLEKYKEIDKNATIDIVKKKYHGLRSSYRRELQKVRRSEKSGAGTCDVYEPSLWYFHHLDFLRDQEVQVEGISTFDDSVEMEKEPSAKKGKFNDDIFLQKAVEHLDRSASNKPRDEATIYSEAWAVGYRKLSEDQKLFAKKLIDESILQGQLGNLNASSCIDIGRQQYARLIHPRVQRHSTSASTSQFSSSSPIHTYQQYSPTQPLSPIEYAPHDSPIQIITNEPIATQNLSFQQLFNNPEFN